MASLNKVFLIGNLTRDPELRYLTGGLIETYRGHIRRYSILLVAWQSSFFTFLSFSFRTLIQRKS